jgi:hypothetical protein
VLAEVYLDYIVSTYMGGTYFVPFLHLCLSDHTGNAIWRWINSPLFGGEYLFCQCSLFELKLLSQLLCFFPLKETALLSGDVTVSSFLPG